MARQQAADLKAKLEKAKEAVKPRKLGGFEASILQPWGAVNQGCLAEELAEVYSDYCQEVWLKALNLAGVLAASEWRKAKNIY